MDTTLTVKAQKNSDKNNIYLNIPRDIERHLDIKRGDKVKFVIRDSGAVELRKVD